MPSALRRCMGREAPEPHRSRERPRKPRYRRRESSVEEALIEMYLAGVSVRRVEDITEALWGTQMRLPGAVSNLNKKIYGQIEAWQNQPIEGRPSPMSTWTASCSSAAGQARFATSHCWWRSRSMPTAIAKFSASPKAPRKTRPGGAASGSATPCSLNRSRPPTKSAKNSGHYPPNLCTQAIFDFDRITNAIAAILQVVVRAPPLAARFRRGPCP